MPASDLLEDAQGYGAAEAEGKVAGIEKGGQKVGYAFLNTDFDAAIGYSGKPIRILIGMDLAGRITGAKMVEHSEPIVLAGIPEHKLVDFIDGYKDLNVVKIAAADATVMPPVDIVSAATVTVLVIDDSIRNSAIRAWSVLAGWPRCKIGHGPRRRLLRLPTLRSTGSV